ncbi:effector-associated domain 2-containing protein [Spirillospora sp. CA-128828]|uniref:VMAP-C domain-containing protein n=1 Tax=Spirillospora sp. CA-128828 TaxID=3240033 RepID=UPI003D94324E
MKALWRLEAIRKRNARDLCVSLLERQLGHPLPLTRDDSDINDVWQLVDSCLSYAGAFHALMTVVEEFHRGSIPMEELRNLVDELLPEPLLHPRERRELDGLLRTLAARAPELVAPDVIRALYWEVTGPSGPALNADPDDLRGVLARLEDLTVSVDSVPPLLAFVEELAASANGRPAVDLQSWAGGLAHRLGLARSLPAARRRAAQASQRRQPRSYLIIEFRPDGAVPDRYLTSAWLQVEGEHGLMLHCDDDPLPFDRLPVLVKELLSENQQVVNRPTPELTLEFVLPVDLLGTPLDQLRITVDGLERRLGIEHPVVVRSLDRMRRQAYHHPWRRKWHWLRDNPRGAKVCWVTQPGQYGGESLYNMLLSEPSSVCLAMAFPPRPDGPDSSDELRAALQAGAPIVAWCRRGRDPGRFVQEFQDLLDMGALALPDTVLTLRRQALRALDEDPGGDHLGLELTLIFDDADRLPEPYVRLKAPA